MKNGVQITNTRFYVSEVNKVVVCTINVDMQLQWGLIYYEAWKRKFPYVDLMGRFETKAIARCNESDTFDVNVGKRIAESRAKAKAFLKAAKVYNCIQEWLEDQSELVTLSAGACLIAKEIEDAHVEELIDG